MKIVLEFDGFDEAEEARNALNGSKWKGSMQELDQTLRSTTKYGGSLLFDGKEATEEELLIAERIREIIREILNQNGLNLDN